MFRESLNKKGLVFLLIIILGIFIYLAWQSGGVITEQEVINIEPVDNYQVAMTFDNVIYQLWRYDNLLKFQQEEQLQFYYDVTEDNLSVYNQDRLITSSSNFSDFIIRYDPYTIAQELKIGLSYGYDENESQYKIDLYGQPATVFLNEYSLPDIILFDNSTSKVQYKYLQVDNLTINQVLPPNNNGN